MKDDDKIVQADEAAHSDRNFEEQQGSKDEHMLEDEQAPEDEQVPEGEQTDRFTEYLAEEYRKYRALAWVLGGVGFSVILIAVGLNMNGILPIKLYNLIMSVAYLFIILMGITIFTRTRPVKRRIKELKGEPMSTLHDENAPDGVKIEKDPKFRDMDDVYKILERDIRTEVIPQDDKYLALRRIWLAVFIAALVIALISLSMYYFIPRLNILASVMLLSSFGLVIVAFYIDRTKMRPMRVEWARRFGMTEMQLRDNFRDFKNQEGK